MASDRKSRIGSDFGSIRKLKKLSDRISDRDPNLNFFSDRILDGSDFKNLFGSDFGLFEDPIRFSPFLEKKIGSKIGSIFLFFLFFENLTIFKVNKVGS